MVWYWQFNEWFGNWNWEKGLEKSLENELDFDDEPWNSLVSEVNSHVVRNFGRS